MNRPGDGERGAPGVRILVWDLPVRVFHWTLAASFAGAWLTAESERLALWHMSFGFTLMGLLLFRLFWGVAGTRHARFASFVAGPGRVLRYLRALLSRQPEHSVGHNPAGALAIVLLLGLGLTTAATGALYWQDLGGEAFEELHEALATLMLGVVGVHVAGVLLSSVLHHENLVGAMVSGVKRGPAGEGISGARPLVALALVVALGGFWAYAWSPASLLRGGEGAAVVAAGAPAAAGRGHDDDGDDD